MCTIKMPASTLLWLSMCFKIGPKGWSHGFVLIYPVLDNLFRNFKNIRRVSIDGRVMLTELRAEISFLALFMKASSKMKCGETELCPENEFLFSTTKHLKNLSLSYDSEAFTLLSQGTFLLKFLRFPHFSFFNFNPFGNSLIGVSYLSTLPQGLL